MRKYSTEEVQIQLLTFPNVMYKAGVIDTQHSSGQWTRELASKPSRYAAPSAVNHVTQIDGPDRTEHLQLQSGSKQTQGIHTFNLTDRHHTQTTNYNISLYLNLSYNDQHK